MILLVTSSERASECAAALHEATGEEVVVAESLLRATTLLRAGCYLAVVLDQYLLETGPDEAGDARSSTWAPPFRCRSIWRSVEWSVWCGRCGRPCSAASARKQGPASGARQAPQRTEWHGHGAAAVERIGS